MSNSFYHKDLTDAQWKKIKCFFTEEKKVGRRPLNPRKVFDGILWILKSSARWRDLPARYGNWNSIYHKFRLWCESGLFKLLLQLINSDTNKTTLLEIDSTFCKVHQSACSALTIIKERMQLINVVLTGGQVNDSELTLTLFGGVELSGKKILADKAYSCEHIRSYLEEHGAIGCILDKELYKHRNIVERFFQRIKNFRHIATRYDKLAICFLNFVLLASFVIHF